MSNIRERITKARYQIDALKGSIEDVRNGKQDGQLNHSKESVQNSGGEPLMGVKSRKVLRGHFGKVYSLHWSSDGLNLISASQDGKLLIWNGMTALKQQAISLRSAWVGIFSFSVLF